jgi:type II secretory pathway component GspD/PulD (secretin)
MNIDPDKAMETVSRLIPNILVAKNEAPDYLVIRGEEDAVKDAEKLISSVDVRSGQILIEGTVIEVSDSGLKDLGVIWGKQQGEFKLSIDKTGIANIKDDTEMVVKALVANGKARVLANPRITALDGKLAEINIGSRIPYSVPASTSSTNSQWTVQYIDAGVNLKIRPSLTNDRYIVSEIVPEVSSISEWRQTMAGEFPVISTRNASVTVRLKEGQTFAIGGLISDSERTNTLKVPFISDIPIVGELFKRNITESSKSDIVFLITPHIVE